MAITRLQNKMVFNSLLMSLTLITLSFQARGALAASLTSYKTTIDVLAPLSGRVFTTNRVLFSALGSFSATIKLEPEEFVSFQAGYKFYWDGGQLSSHIQNFSATGSGTFTFPDPPAVWPPLGQQFVGLNIPEGNHSVTFEVGIFSSDFQAQPEIKTQHFTVVPEPLTILGSGLAIGFGAWLQKDFSKKRKKIN